jgi:hypothetical protein
MTVSSGSSSSPLGEKVELLLHPGDVRVRCLDVEPGGRAELGVVADVAVDDDHLLVGDVLVLALRPALASSRLIAWFWPSGSSVTMKVEPSSG